MDLTIDSMEIMHTYPLPPNGWHQELMMMMKHILKWTTYIILQCNSVKRTREPYQVPHHHKAAL